MLIHGLRQPCTEEFLAISGVRCAAQKPCEMHLAGQESVRGGLASLDGQHGDALARIGGHAGRQKLQVQRAVNAASSSKSQ